MSSYTVRKLKIGNTEHMQTLSRAAGELYSRTVVNVWRTVRKQDKWLQPSSMMRWLPNDSENRLHAHSADEVPAKESGTVAGIDLGEIHLAGAHDSKETIIVNGRLLRSKHRYQNKLKAKPSGLIDGKKRGSKRRRRLIRSKQRQLAKLNNQIRDIQHKQTAKFVCTLNNRGVRIVVIGNIQDIRKSVDYGKKANQTCPACDKRHKPKSCLYKCSCGFQFHRDAVGSINIRRKYLECFDVPVVGAMASPFGVRYSAHLQCSPTHHYPQAIAMCSGKNPRALATGRMSMLIV